MTKRLLGVAALLAVALGLRDSNLAAPAPPELYVFVQDLDRVVGVRRGGWIIYGQLNADGELIADGKHQIGAPIHLPRWTNHVVTDFAADEARPCYEYHSGFLIKGVMTVYGRFIPEEGSRVTKFEDYRYVPKGPPIWNLPGFFMSREQLEERRRWLSEHLGEKPEYGEEKARLDAAAAANRK